MRVNGNERSDVRLIDVEPFNNEPAAHYWFPKDLRHKEQRRLCAVTHRCGSPLGWPFQLSL
jgi:hypothetical protein